MLLLFLFFNVVLLSMMAVLWMLVGGSHAALHENAMALSVAAAVADALLLVVLVAVGLVRRGPAIAGRRLSLGGSATALAAFLLCVIGVGLLVAPLHLDTGMTEALFGTMQKSALGLFVMVVLAPLTEEMVFREGIQRSIAAALKQKGHDGAWLPIILTSVVFAAVHGNPAQAVPAFLLSLVLGLLYQRTGGIGLPVVAHVLNNVLAVVAMRVTIIDEVVSGQSAAVSLSAGIGATAIGAALLYAWWHKNDNV